MGKNKATMLWGGRLLGYSAGSFFRQYKGYHIIHVCQNLLNCIRNPALAGLPFGFHGHGSASRRGLPTRPPTKQQTTPLPASTQ